MEKFNTLSEQDKKTIFQEAASRHGVLPIVIEKDFWVCWSLKHLYAEKSLADYLTFKGGTSLSKAYGLIERFSEDIDLTIDQKAPFLADISNPMDDGISGKERNRRIIALKKAAQSFVAEIALPTLRQKIQQALSQYKSGDWKLFLDEYDPDQQTLLFQYPKISSHADDEVAYIKPVVRFEFGARGETQPSEKKMITPYVANIFPQLFDMPNVAVKTLAVERTFWEKATILHALHHGTKLRARMSRHYYDLYMMAKKGVTDMATKDLELLTAVVKNKKLLFKDNKASYDTALIDTLRLLPDDVLLMELKKDYAAMHEMFMGTAPAFDEMMAALALLENQLQQSV